MYWKKARMRKEKPSGTADAFNQAAKLKWKLN